MTPALLEEQQIALLENGVRIIALRELGDRDAADDVVQETLARTLKALASEQLRDPLRLGAFVRGIAHNVIADVIRKKTRRGTEPLDSVVVVADAPDALAALISGEEQLRVNAAMRRLSRDDFEVLRLSFFEGLSPAEIAA